MSDPVLEARARAVEEGRQQVAVAQARVAELTGPYEAARDELGRLRKGLKIAELALEAAKREHVIARAVEEAGIEYEGPAFVVVTVYERAWVYYLVAVGPEGAGLYLHTPERSHRYQGKEYAIRSVQAPDDVSRRGSSVLEEAGLTAWEARGAGQFGAGSGAMKPKPPPEGGRWRWLKVRDQEALGAGEAAA